MPPSDANRSPRDLLGSSRSEEQLDLIVDPEEDGWRLDRFLSSRAPWRSRTWHQKRCEAGDVTVDGEPVRASRRLRPGQRVRVELGQDDRPDRGGDLGDLSAFPLVVLHEDEHLAVVDKPAGMVAHPVGGYRKSTLINVLHAHYRHAADPARDRVPTLVNRIDRHTSGLVVVALSDRARQLTAELFADHSRVEKRYLALVEGHVRDRHGAWEWPIGPDRGHHVRIRRAVVDPPKGRPARTRYEVLSRLQGATLLELVLETGRKHQIRVHAAHAGHPLIADRVYGQLRDPTYYADVDQEEFAAQLEALPIQRHALHAYRLGFDHPVSGSRIDVEALMPVDLQQAIETLSKRS